MVVHQLHNTFGELDFATASSFLLSRLSYQLPFSWLFKVGRWIGSFVVDG